MLAVLVSTSFSMGLRHEAPCRLLTHPLAPRPMGKFCISSWSYAGLSSIPGSSSCPGGSWVSVQQATPPLHPLSWVTSS